MYTQTIEKHTGYTESIWLYRQKPIHYNVYTVQCIAFCYSYTVHHSPLNTDYRCLPFIRIFITYFWHQSLFVKRFSNLFILLPFSMMLGKIFYENTARQTVHTVNTDLYYMHNYPDNKAMMFHSLAVWI